MGAAWGGPGGIKEEKGGSWRGSRQSRRNKDEAADFSNNSSSQRVAGSRSQLTSRCRDFPEVRRSSDGGSGGGGGCQKKCDCVQMSQARTYAAVAFALQACGGCGNGQRLASVNNGRTDQWFVFTRGAGTVTVCVRACVCVHMLLCEGGVRCASPAVYHGGFENCRQLASSFILSLNSGCSRVQQRSLSQPLLRCLRSCSCQE